MKTYKRVHAEINLDAIRHNIEEFRANVPAEAELCAVIKTDGYGLGAVPAAKVVEDIVWGFAAATVDEAINLRQHGIAKPILVLGYVPEERFEELITNEIRFAGFQPGKLKKLNSEALRLGKKAYVHLKIDTGMNRIGVKPSDVPALAEMAAGLSGIIVEGMFTHLATADMIKNEPAIKQQKLFEETVRKLKDADMCPEICHCANSAAGIWMTDAPTKLFRIGISLYGYYPSEEVDKTRVSLIPAMELKSVVAFIKEIPAGESVGYGGTFVTKRTTKVATIPVGYGDGYPRALSNKGSVIIRGQKVPIIGRVCMDQIMVDITDTAGICEEDTVTLIGKDNGCEITAEEVAELAGSFNYELLCDLGKRIPRVYFRNGIRVGAKDYFDDRYEIN